MVVCTRGDRYGGNSIEGNLVPRYQLLVPKGWRAETITKQQKGYSGVDTLFVDPLDRSNRVYVATFLREGESNKTFSLTDPSKTLTGLAASDYNLQVRRDARGVGRWLLVAVLTRTRENCAL